MALASAVNTSSLPLAGNQECLVYQVSVACYPCCYQSLALLSRAAGEEHIITSDGFFDLEHLPARTVVVGGGYIATEIAGVLNALGSSVTMVIRGGSLLQNFDVRLPSLSLDTGTHHGSPCCWCCWCSQRIVRETLEQEMATDGVDIEYETEVTKVER